VAILAGQIRSQDDAEYISRVSIPGVLTGETVELFSGQVIPVVVPSLRLMYGWSESALVEASLGAAKELSRKEGRTFESEDEGKLRTTLRTILDRFYYDLRNLGQTSAERAMNFAATNAFQFAMVVLSDTVAKGQQLDTINVERSSFCRKDSDCWDVKLRFFDPDNVLRSRSVFRFTVDVSDVHPVLIGKLRQWNEAP
jgi:cyanobactin maturation PatA/PatG family protease